MFPQSGEHVAAFCRCATLAMCPQGKIPDEQEAVMGAVQLSLSMSIDGYVTGRNPTRENPLGDAPDVAVQLVSARREAS
jgi:hypothetical protein